jgi:hypothetical protein
VINASCSGPYCGVRQIISYLRTDPPTVSLAVAAFGLFIASLKEVADEKKKIAAITLGGFFIVAALILLTHLPLSDSQISVAFLSIIIVVAMGVVSYRRSYDGSKSTAQSQPWRRYSQQSFGTG